MEGAHLRHLKDKIAVVTGGSSGIGRSIALELANYGCKLAVVGTSQERIDGTLALMPVGRESRGYVCNVSDRAAVMSLADAVEGDFGGVDIIVNNAGITSSAPFTEFDMELFDRIVKTNFFGVVNCCHAFLPKLQNQEHGHIVNMSSMLGFVGVPNQSAYVSTKFAIRGFTESLWAELYSTPIAVTGIYPGTIQSEILERASFSDEFEKAAMIKMMDRFGIPASDVAVKTVNAIRRRRREVIIGRDARALVLLKRFLPTLCHYLTSSVLHKVQEKIHSGEW
jgi:NAD(P)-dependent dehydrogenase (short-subunit alcohol dehydrogenase family)